MLQDSVRLNLLCIRPFIPKAKLWIKVDNAIMSQDEVVVEGQRARSVC